MQSIAKLIIAAFVVIGLGACGTGLDKAQSTSPGGDEFTQALYKYYTQRASHEYGYGNYESSDWFAGRAIQAAGGEAVPPQDVLSINTPQQLAQVDQVLCDRLGRHRAEPTKPAAP